jgi:hypothetical protein
MVLYLCLMATGAVEKRLIKVWTSLKLFILQEGGEGRWRQGQLRKKSQNYFSSAFGLAADPEPTIYFNADRHPDTGFVMGAHSQFIFGMKRKEKYVEVNQEKPKAKH